MGVLPDGLIRQLALDPRTRMIEPFSERVADPGKLVSWGLQPAGYDARLDPEVYAFHWAQAQGAVLDPLNLDPDFYVPQHGTPVIELPPHSFMQGMTIEYFQIPRNITVRGCGKNVYTSVGIGINIAGIHPGWGGATPNPYREPLARPDPHLRRPGYRLPRVPRAHGRVRGSL